MARELLRLGVRWFLFVASLSAQGCSSEPEVQFDYDAEDLRRAVLGSWTGVYTDRGGAAAPLVLSITEPASAPNRLACSSRTFGEASSGTGLHAADAAPSARLSCISSSSLAVSAKLTVQGTALDEVPFTGEFFVASTLLSHGELSLTGVDSGYSVYGQWSSGEWSSVRAQRDAEHIGELEIQGRD